VSQRPWSCRRRGVYFAPAPCRRVALPQTLVAHEDAREGAERMAATVTETLRGVARWQGTACVTSREGAKTVLTVVGELQQFACAGSFAGATSELQVVH